jgi:hypothetical protein
MCFLLVTLLFKMIPKRGAEECPVLLSLKGGLDDHTGDHMCVLSFPQTRVTPVWPCVTASLVMDFCALNHELQHPWQRL